MMATESKKGAGGAVIRVSLAGLFPVLRAWQLRLLVRRSTRNEQCRMHVGSGGTGGRRYTWRSRRSTWPRQT
jgi:hypothetical protein